MQERKIKYKKQVKIQAMKKLFLEARSKAELRGIAKELEVKNYEKLPTAKLKKILVIYPYKKLVKALKAFYL